MSAACALLALAEDETATYAANLVYQLRNRVICSSLWLARIRCIIKRRPAYDPRLGPEVDLLC